MTISATRRAALPHLLACAFALLSAAPSAFAGASATVSCHGNSAGQSVCNTTTRCNNGAIGVCNNCIGGANACANSCLQSTCAGNMGSSAQPPVITDASGSPGTGSGGTAGPGGTGTGSGAGPGAPGGSGGAPGTGSSGASGGAGTGASQPPPPSAAAGTSAQQSPPRR
ncbi:hypothetical protein [Stutzerimonas kunmingensis]|uniref:hypothetical protein n=1 Tax=Stutzerimonas kunmingensis TaxID=1211807 RepID=UPI00242D10F1|nr:hypothetical protein [Stutzerimonas kunmingensis]